MRVGNNLHTKRLFGGFERMKEQKETENKEQKRKPKMSKEKKFYLFTAIGCAAALVTIIVVAAVVNSLNDKGNNQALNPPVNSVTPDDSADDMGGGEQVGSLPDGMTLPVVEAAVINDHGFYFNKTLNSYYEHLGMDFSAEEGAQVFAVEDGVVESIYKDDLLSGTEIVVAHADGVKSVYRFVVEAENLTVGAEVKKGDVIATVAAATGDEYKDGAHLHFEILKNGTSVDPTGYLTLEEK